MARRRNVAKVKRRRPARNAGRRRTSRPSRLVEAVLRKQRETPDHYDELALTMERPPTSDFDPLTSTFRGIPVKIVDALLAANAGPAAAVTGARLQAQRIIEDSLEPSRRKNRESPRLERFMDELRPRIEAALLARVKPGREALAEWHLQTLNERCLSLKNQLATAEQANADLREAATKREQQLQAAPAHRMCLDIGSRAVSDQYREQLAGALLTHDHAAVGELLQELVAWVQEQARTAELERLRRFVNPPIVMSRRVAGALNLLPGDVIPVADPIRVPRSPVRKTRKKRVGRRPRKGSGSRRSRAARRRAR